MRFKNALKQNQNQKIEVESSTDERGAHMVEVGTDDSNSLRRSKQRLRGGHPLVDLIVLFVGKKALRLDGLRESERGDVL